jgi:diaminohydroxyphosphoribosylaminopyrimidine deaminase/5-amino-6-(5-phosphoribosylamino)uracil reductase
MVRALELAHNGPARGINPRVGCVLIDSSGTIVAEGWHQGSGTPHAEVMALTGLSDKGISAAGLTAVVTLEPCAHTGKTGPCAKALIDAGIARVVFSVSDPGVGSGGGADILSSAGVEVVSGVEEVAGRELIERWLLFATQGRPWITIKWAMSLDGRAAAADGTSQWITGPETRQRVHLDRSRHDAIVVGTGTVLADDPTLTARNDNGSLMDHQPHAVVVGQRAVPETALIRTHPGGFTHHQSQHLGQLMDVLFSKGIRSVYVEGGPTLASAFLAQGLYDELHISLGPLLLGGGKLALTDLGVSTMAEALPLDIHDVLRFEGDVFLIAKPRKDDA